MHDSDLVLVVDDEREMRRVLCDFLHLRGFETRAFADATSLLRARNEELKSVFEEGKVALVIADIRMPGISGLELLEQLRQSDPHLPVIMITAFGNVDSAVAAVRRGASDYVVKPFKLEDLDQSVQRAITRAQSVSNRQFRPATNAPHQIIGRSKPMQRLFELIQRVGQSQASVLISGESGTGKELVARAIHASSPRRHARFVALNCAAIPETLLESELFGHTKGAFTGALFAKKGMFVEGHRGTIFLDEIGDMPMLLQGKLLRAIQDRSIRPLGANQDDAIDVRFITATHDNLMARVRAGSFREDLYYRINVVPIQVPPLRAHPEDIPELIDHFLTKFSCDNTIAPKSIDPAAVEALVRYSWPGNVRELENMIERLVVMTGGAQIGLHDLPPREGADSLPLGDAIREHWPLKRLEENYIRMVLHATNGRKAQAARILGVNRRTLYRKEREFGLVGAQGTK